MNHKFRIVSDGTAPSTGVYGPDGKRLTGVKSISFNVSVEGFIATAMIEFNQIELDGRAVIQVSEEHLKIIADSHGYVLQPKVPQLKYDKGDANEFKTPCP